MGSPNILIVEDETITALDLRNQLRQLGYGMTALAKSGEDAVRMSEEFNPDLILMDVKLAGAMNGIEASQRIRKTRTIPVIYVTAHADLFVKAPNQMQPPYLCISKPFSLSELKNAIGVALEP
jgi:CheY-like chemotaxis protein